MAMKMKMKMKMAPCHPDAQVQADVARRGALVAVGRPDAVRRFSG
jgi:hypothetical protein